MKNEKTLAKQLLNAVWDEDSAKVKRVLLEGADPNWIFNGYPILLHAVFTRNQEMVLLLIHHGASQLSEALGFALDRGIGEMVRTLAFLGIVPKPIDTIEEFGPYPARYAPLDYRYH